MIFTERTITVVNDSATINKPLILYRGDKNIELKITIAESQFKFRNTDASNVIETTDASYAQLVINTPYNSPIFSDVAVTKNGAVIFVITEAMIDEIREVGAYEIQIRLLDDNKQSRASIPPVSNAIEIREPIAIEDGSAVDSNAVNTARVNRALTTTSAPLEAFDSQGNYIKKTWGDGDPITDAALNKMETAIDGVNKKIGNNRSQIKNKANKSDLEVQKQRIDDLNNLLDVKGVVTSNNRIDDSKIVGQNFDTIFGHSGGTTLKLDSRLKSRLIKGFIEFEDGTSPDTSAGFGWTLVSSTGEVSNTALSVAGTLIVSDDFDKYDEIYIECWATYNKNIKTFFIGAFDDSYDNYRVGLTSKVLDDIKISAPDNWYRDKKICAYGDSVVEQEKWQPYVASYLKCSFYNRGVGGTTVTQVNSSTNHMSGDTRINTIPTDSDVILILAGHNDWSYDAINMGDLKTDVLSESTSFKSAYALMLKKIQARCPNAKIITMTPVGGRTEDATTNQDKQFYVRDLCMTDFAIAIKEVSAYYGIPCIDVNANCGINTLNHTTYIADLIHPNDAGGKLIANEVINGMKRFQPIDL